MKNLVNNPEAIRNKIMAIEGVEACEFLIANHFETEKDNKRWEEELKNKEMFHFICRINGKRSGLTISIGSERTVENLFKEVKQFIKTLQKRKE